MDRLALDEDHRTRILELAQDVPRLWHDSATPVREQKRLLRLIIEDVTLLKGSELVVHVCFRGGATQTLTLPRPLPAWAARQTRPEVVAEVDRLLADYTDAQIARSLTEHGLRSGTGKPINPMMVRRIRVHYRLTPRYDRLRKRGLLTQDQMARVLGVCAATVKHWRQAGLLQAHTYNDKPEYLYEPPGPDAPVRYAWKGLSHWDRARGSMSQPSNEVQCEA